MAQLTYKIAKLWGKQEGSTEKHEIDEKIEFPEDKDLNFSGNFTARLTFIRLKDEISALLSDGNVEVEFNCTHCLNTVDYELEIPAAEREFFYDKPDFESDDLADIFYIDKKRMVIDLNEMVRQEIILHFPLIPVCSKSCKGLCPVCGKDRNKVQCKCKYLLEEETDTIRPFKDLKKLI